MIQRVQSFLLVLAVVGVVLMFRFPIATYTSSTTTGDIRAELRLTNTKSIQTDDMQDYRFVGDDLAKLGGKWVLDVVAAAIGVLALVSIFMYKNRQRQIKVVAFAFLFNVVYIFLIFFWAVNGSGGNGGYLNVLQGCGLMGTDIKTEMLTVGTIAPVVTTILLFLSQRAIRSDELKVRSADRLR